MKRGNVRLIVIIVAFGLVLLLAASLIGIGYLQASSQSIGHFAPIGTPINGKHK